MTRALWCAVLASACGAGDAGIGGPSPGDAPIVGVVWHLTQVSRAGEGTAFPPPATFTLELRRNGELHVVADCNRCNGSYSLEGQAFEVEGGVLACTRAACPSSPFDTDYVALVAGARSWEGDAASLTLEGEANRLRFERSPP